MDDVEGTGEPLGSSTGMIFVTCMNLALSIHFFIGLIWSPFPCTGSEKNGKESTKSFSSKEYSQLTVNPKTSDDKTDIVYVA